MRDVTFIFWIVSYLSYVKAVQILVDEVVDLMKIRNDLEENKTVLPTWTAENIECEHWAGLTCDGEGRVTEIYLSTEDTLLPSGSIRKANLPAFSDFSGQLSSAIGSLTRLTSLTLASLGHVSGLIPPNIGNLPSLKYLNLSGNILFGPIPSSFGNLLHLDVLDLHGNQNLGFDGKEISALNGTIPSTLAPLNFKLFDISQNAFGGPAPPFLKLQRSLRYLSLSENSFEGSLSSFLPDTSNLTYLALAFNGFSGPLDTVLSSLISLKYLDVSSNKLFGPIPEFLGDLPKLEHLDISGNGFVSLPNLEKLQKLSFFKAAENDLQGIFPESIGTLANLEHLELQRNGFNGTLNLQGLKKIKYLDLSYNALSISRGNSNFLGTFIEARTILLDYVYFGGNVPSTLGNIKSLTTFSCSSCGFSGSIPDNLENLKLELLDLSRNNLTGAISESLCQLKSMRYLDLSNNYLEGIIPLCLGQNLTGLLSLRLFNNSLSGEIPLSIASNPCVNHLELQRNFLTGNVPAFGSGAECDIDGTLVFSSDIYFHIDLSSNNLSGSPFPSTLTELSALTHLILSFNPFTSDNIPSGIGQLTLLETLICRSCNLIGALPPSLMLLNSLKYL